MIEQPPTDDSSSRSPAAIEALTADALARADARIAEAAADPAPTFQSLFGALDDAARMVALAYGQGAFLRSVDPDEAVRAAGSDASDLIDKWRAALPQRDDLATAVATFVGSSAASGLNPDQAALVRHWQRDVRQSGAGLDPAARAELHGLLERLVEVQGAFVMNLARTADVEVEDKELEGVPEHVVAGLQPGGKPGSFVVPVNDANAAAFLENARLRDVRARIDHAFLNRGMPENRLLLDEALTLRRRAAALLGYPSWLDLRAEGFAAADAAAIEGFIADMSARMEPVARAELLSMRELLLQEPGAPQDLVVEDWDWRYADARQRAALGADPAQLRAYLAFGDVFAGLCELSEEVFGIRIEARPERRGWHPDVRAFDLVDRDSGVVRAGMFFDPFVRPGKQGPAFAEMLDPGVPGKRPPTMALVTNFTKPGKEPSLLGAEQLDMLFHEFGHVLDFGLGAEPFVLHRFDAWVPMDWVEAPSQFLGRWGQQPSVLAKFGRHHLTGEPIPSELLDALAHLDSLNIGVKSMRHLSMGQLDVHLHGEANMSIDRADDTAWRLRGLPRPADTCFPATLIHLLGGYDGAIYGFLWSQVLRDDLMSKFERDGMTSPSVGAAYRAALLEAPWTRDPLACHAAFLGRPWSIDAFLARAERGLAGSPPVAG